MTKRPTFEGSTPLSSELLAKITAEIWLDPSLEADMATNPQATVAKILERLGEKPTEYDPSTYPVEDSPVPQIGIHSSEVTASYSIWCGTYDLSCGGCSYDCDTLYCDTSSCLTNDCANTAYCSTDDCWT